MSADLNADILTRRPSTPPVALLTELRVMIASARSQVVQTAIDSDDKATTNG